FSVDDSVFGSVGLIPTKQSHVNDSATTLPRHVEPALRVLLVDNDGDEANRSEAGIQARLGNRASVRRVATLGQAIRLLSSNTFDVVLLELMLHDATGI